MLFSSVELNNFMKSLISFDMASAHITDASDFAIRKVSFNPEKGRQSYMNLRSPGPEVRQTITVKVKISYAGFFFQHIFNGLQVQYRVHFKTK